MGIGELFGEVHGNDCIDIGDIVSVTVLYGTKEYIGRLNEVSKEFIVVGGKRLKVRNIIKIIKIDSHKN